MHLFIIGGILISCFTPINAMDTSQLQMIWITTHDQHLIPIKKQSAKHSNLITVLTENGNNSKDNPLPLPINKAGLDFFCATLLTSSTGDSNNPLKPSSYPAQQLRNTLAHDAYYELIDAADKLKARAFYINLIDEIIPHDVSALSIPEHIRNALKNKIIQQHLTSNIFIKGQRDGSDSRKMLISNNGRYLTHKISLQVNANVNLALWNTKTCTHIKTFFSPYRLSWVHFSPDSTYIIVRGDPNIFVYTIAEDKEYPLILPDYFNKVRNIQISPDSRHIIISGMQDDNTDVVRHALWSLDTNNVPQSITLDAPYWETYIHSVVFHPNNEQIIYNARRKTLQTCLIASPNDLIERKKDEDVFAVDDLLITADGTHILAENYYRQYDGFGQALFTIENCKDIQCTEFPNQSLDNQCDSCPRLYIPHKKLITHISNNGHTLELLDTNAHSIASHTTKNCTVSALAVDTTGNYCASGYSDGSIIIWDLSDTTKKICGTKVIASKTTITSLTFSDNQLLLSCSAQRDHKPYHPGTVALWDVHGNQIFNFGPMTASIMSENGNSIITVAQELVTHDLWDDSFVTLTAWDLHNKKTKKQLNTLLTHLTLSQAFALIECPD